MFARHTQPLLSRTWILFAGGRPPSSGPLLAVKPAAASFRICNRGSARISLASARPQTSEVVTMAIDEALTLDTPTPDQHPAGEATPKATSIPRKHRPRWHDYTAFVLSGGGARGALQVGMLKALLEHGEYPDVLVGTSVGAWNGAWLAREPTLPGVAALESVWSTLKPVHVLLGREPAANTPSQVLRGMLMIAA